MEIAKFSGSRERSRATPAAAELGLMNRKIKKE